MKTIIRNPEMMIDVKDDGVWLHFKVDGLCSSLNLPYVASQRGRMVDQTILMWCEAYAYKEKKEIIEQARAEKEGT